MSTLRSSLDTLAESFASAVLDAVVRGTNIEELIGSMGSRIMTTTPTGTSVRLTRPTAAAKPAKTGRLPRRSAEDIAAVLGQIVALVRKNRDGLRAEQIRANLGLEAKELPRALKEGIATKKLRIKGQKRATTYFAV